jgi:mono/diheme cytochrome c family protein
MKVFIRIIPAVALWVAVAASISGQAPANRGVRLQADQTSGRLKPAPTSAAAAAQSKPTTATAAADPGVDPALLKTYCVTCHNERMKTGGLALDGLDVNNVGAHAEIFEKVVLKVKTGVMPPSGSPRPSRAALDTFAAGLESRLDKAAAPNASLSTPGLHRLNRVEYKNAVRDLLALDVDVSSLLPADGSSEGFDNIAEALAVSPSLVQGYVSAAMKISRQAVGDRSAAASQIVYAAPAGLAQDRHIDGLPLGTRGGMVFTHTFPLDAEYEFSVGGGGPGGGGGAATDFSIDGDRIQVQNLRKFRMPVSAGPHTISVAVLDRNRGAGVDDIYSDFRKDAAFVPGGGVQNVTILGPFNGKGAGETPSRNRIFSCRPTTSAEEAACARTILSTLARRAYRGPVSQAEIDLLMKFYQQGRTDEGGDFETGVQHGLARILVAPRFIFRVEEEPKTVAAGARYRISDIELASRLSFFLWSTIPDDELLDVATKGRLRDSVVLRAQVKRMLADPKSEAIIKNFAGQWLYLRELANVQTEAKNFDDNLRTAFQKETEMLFGAIVREDRNLVELLDADYTFVDERLARHYGIPDVRGSHFRRVSLPVDSPRRGLLGSGGMLTITSVATRTSPVSRGKWILENLLGAPPPEPPPGVEVNLEADPKAEKPTTLRQRLELHRRSPQCAGCHRLMDPIGFALENFDQVGTWRETEAGQPIDSTGQLADGSPLKGIADLRKAVLSRSEAFMSTAARKMLTYALGRPVHHDDMPVVRTIVRRAAADKNRFSSLILGVVESAPFQMRIKKADSTAIRAGL